MATLVLEDPAVVGVPVVESFEAFLGRWHGVVMAEEERDGDGKGGFGICRDDDSSAAAPDFIWWEAGLAEGGDGERVVAFCEAFSLIV